MEDLVSSPKSQLRLIGVDIGTSSTKVAIVSGSGRVLGQVVRHHEVRRRHENWAEHDAVLDWWLPAASAISELMTDTATRPETVAGIGCSGVCPVVLPVDTNGRPLRAAILYSIDSRAESYAQFLEDEIGLDAIILRSGQRPGNQSVIPKLMWLRDHEPKTWLRTDTVLGAAGFLIQQLCGAKTVDHFTAADGGFGYHLSSGTWDDHAFLEAGIDSTVMPSLYWPSDIVGTVSASAAALTNLAEGTPVIAGTGDALAEMLGTGTCDHGETAVIYGSSCSTMTVMRDWWMHDGFISVPGWDRDTIVTSAVLNVGSDLFKWWLGILGDPPSDSSFEALMADLEGVKQESSIPLFLPYLAGQRSPRNDRGLRGALLGLSRSHTRAHITRAMAEGLAFALRDVFESLPDPLPSAVRISGGGIRHCAVLQIVSDVTGVTQNLATIPAAAPIGAAWLAGVATVGLTKEDLKSWVTSTRRIEPDLCMANHYNEQFTTFRSALQLARTISRSKGANGK